jgi:hypothetical protein
MEDKYILGMLLLMAGAFGGTLLCCISRRVRDVFFFLLVTMSVVTEYWDINFDGRDWYRGTTRGFEISLVDIFSISLLVSMFLFPRRGEKRWYWPASIGLMVLYFCFAGFCVGITDPHIFGLFQLSKMLRGLIMFLAVALYVRQERELRLFLFAMALAVCYEGLTALKQRYLYGMHRVEGTVDDSNSLSMYFCTTAPMFVAVITSRLPRYFKLLAGAAIALACVGVVLTISRTGIVTIALVLACATLTTMTWKITGKKLVMVTLVLLAATGITAKSWKTLSARFKESNLEQEYQNKHGQNRGYYIRLAGAMAADRPFGVGPNNWSYWVSNEYGPKLGWHFVPYIGTEKEPSHLVPAGRNIDDAQAAPAHSLWALTAGEMGYGGLAIFLLLWFRWLQMGWSFLRKRVDDPMRRIGVGIFFGFCGTFLQSLTEWVFHQTPIFYTFNIMAGVLASLYFLKKHPVQTTVPQTETTEDSEWEVVVEPAAHY